MNRKLMFFLFIGFVHQLYSVNIYVSPNGSDINGFGTKSAPFLTIPMAIGVLPHNCENTIFLSAGEFEVLNQIIVPTQTNLIGEGTDKTIVKCENYFNIYSTAKSKCYEWQAAPALDPHADETATFIFNGKNQKISGITFDGSNKKVITPILIVRGENFTFDNISCRNFKVSGWWLHEGYNVTLKNSHFVNNSFGNFNQNYGAVMFHRADNLTICNNYINEHDTKSYGIKMASKNQLCMWSQSDDWTEKTVNDNLQIYNNTIVVGEEGSWTVPNDTTIRVPTISIEFNSRIKNKAKIHNNWLNNTISIVSAQQNQNCSYEIYNNLIDLRSDDKTKLNKYAYFLEANEENFNIHHNLIIGGYYPISTWEKDKVQNKNCLIHHNIFYGPAGGAERLNIFAYGSGYNSYKFYNNTVIDVNNVNRFFAILNNERCNLNAEFRNNIFFTKTNRGDIIGDDCVFNGNIDCNLFCNMTAKGTNSITGDPLFKLDGKLDDLRYYTLKKNSPAINTGSIIDGITENHRGCRPDMGALEYGKKIFVVGPISLKK